jgi:hypothetical protein
MSKKAEGERETFNSIQDRTQEFRNSGLYARTLLADY